MMRHFWTASHLFMLAWPAGCVSAEGSSNVPDESATSGGAYFVPQFEDVTVAAGVTLDHPSRTIAVIDFDLDGNLDLVFEGSSFFRGNGDGTFSNITSALFEEAAPNTLGIYGTASTARTKPGSVWADIDNDGDLDFYFFKDEDGVNVWWDVWPLKEGEARHPAGDFLYVNHDGVFVRADEALPDLVPLIGKHMSPTMGAAWADYDADGHVDLATAQRWSSVFCCGATTCQPALCDPAACDRTVEKPGQVYPQCEIGNVDLLFHNTGIGSFEDATPKMLGTWFGGDYPRTLTRETLVSEMNLNKATGVSWGDFDNDGDQDLYTSNYRLSANFLFRNSGGAFEEVASDLACEGDLDMWNGGFFYGHTVGSAWGDFDNDGWLDLAAGNVSHPNDYLGQGIPTHDFSDETYLFQSGEGQSFTDVHGSLKIPWQHRPGTPVWGDVNNDGYLDLYLPAVYDAVTPDHRSALLLSRAGASFDTETAASGIGERYDGSAVFADLNSDGWLDLVVGGNSSGPRVLLNRGSQEEILTDNHFVALTLVGNGTTSNRSAIGARITMAREDGTQVIREVVAGFGSGSQGPLAQHVGLGVEGGAVRVVIRWPDGELQTIESLESDRMHIIEQGRSD